MQYSHLVQGKTGTHINDCVQIKFGFNDGD